ncbi:hypothetical protein [Reticulibacter mediterranei]|uniref:hypothetical protein n=1 Tax=Reticulibacter mediterranei TaxID=2778369 RepID=UPI001C68877C|nr:hypothetical protein [Reticulibacter mediterranei]
MTVVDLAGIALASSPDLHTGELVLADGHGTIHRPGLRHLRREDRPDLVGHRVPSSDDLEVRPADGKRSTRHALPVVLEFDIHGRASNAGHEIPVRGPRDLDGLVVLPRLGERAAIQEVVSLSGNLLRGRRLGGGGGLRVAIRQDDPHNQADDRQGCTRDHDDAGPLGLRQPEPP